MTDSQEYRHNHYVPKWYQKRFMLPGQSKYWYLDLKPEIVEREGVRYRRQDLLPWGPPSCFAQDDLYTTSWGNVKNTDIERFFFGKLDDEGKRAVEWFDSYQPVLVDGEIFSTFLRYMSVQKLRTPKGLGSLQQMAAISNRNLTLLSLQNLQQMHCAIWTESVWQLADATNSPTKFIISDHPVTVYNRDCFPMSEHCRGYSDPDIRFAATQTYFPLSLNRILILTNLSWVRNPYQDALTVRPNPALFRSAMFNFTDIQTGRELIEDEVIQINYITKRRAYRYIAAAQKDWLYPEHRLGEPHWRKLGDGYLLMPDPRHIHMGGEIIIGYKGGHSDAFSEYGHKPWDRDYRNEERDLRDGDALERFKAEWSTIVGPKYRGVSHHIYWPSREPPLEESEEMHAHYLAADERNRQRPGERQRRRRLMR